MLLSSKAEAFLTMVEMGRTDRVRPWYSSDIERRKGPGIASRGLFAIENIPEHTLVAIKHRRVLSELTPEEVDANRIGYRHSGEPNADIMLPEGVSLDFVVTRQDIAAGEEVTVDLLGRDGV